MLDQLPILIGTFLGVAISNHKSVQKISDYVADSLKRASLSVPISSLPKNAEDDKAKG